MIRRQILNHMESRMSPPDYFPAIEIPPPRGYARKPWTGCSIVVLPLPVITKDQKLIGDILGEVVLNIDFKGFKAFEVLRMDSGYFHLAPLGHSFSQVKKNGNTTIDKETEQE